MNYARGYFAVGLCLPRDDKNVACALRACGCFNAAFLAYSGRRYQRHAADTQKTWRHLPLQLAGDEPADILKLTPYACTPVAVEIDPRAKSLSTFHHPERAYYIFGPEDGSIPENVLTQCAEIVRIPSRYSCNLAMAVSITLYDRTAKQALNRTAFANGVQLS